MPIFIGGYARTGTTLIQGIICSDEKAFPVTKESSYFRCLISPYEYGKRIWGIHTNDYFDTLYDFKKFHKELINKYLNHIRDRWGHDKQIVQKEPTMTLYFPEILELVENSLFIVMIRDPRDTISSQIVRHTESIGENYKRNVQGLLNEYFNRYNRLLTNKQIFDNQLLFVQYEQLINQTDLVLDRLRKFTGLKLAIDPREDTWAAKRDLNNESYSPLDGKPLSNKSIGNYKNILTDQEISLIEQFRDS